MEEVNDSINVVIATVAILYFRGDIVQIVLASLLVFYPAVTLGCFEIMAGPLSFGHVLVNAEAIGLSQTESFGILGSTMSLGIIQIMYLKCIKDLGQPLSNLSKQLAILSMAGGKAFHLRE